MEKRGSSLSKRDKFALCIVFQTLPFVQGQVHHLHPRSLLGEDAERILITLCPDCHRAVHLRLGAQS
jgi:5-methylcytosine-specific restriction endonuclease McrA